MNFPQIYKGHAFVDSLLKMELRIVLVFMLCICFIDARKLLMMLVDGFRWDYFNLPGLHLKGFPRFMREGVKADYMIPDFPTNSFPNYKTIETGK